MRLKIYIFKKKQLIWASVILALVIISAILIVTVRATHTINFFSMPDSYKSDINNDGRVDSVVVKVDDVTQKYSINVICSDENGYSLEPDPVIKSFGNSDGKSPINVTFNDINGDGNQEIFIQSSDSSGPILHVFKYTGDKIERIASGRYSMYGVVKNPIDHTNMLVLASNVNSKLKFTYLKSDYGILTPYIASSSLNLGKEALTEVINYIENKDVAAFNPEMDQQVEREVMQGNLLDGIIKDVKFSDYDVPVELTYLLRTDSTSDGKDSMIKYKVKLSLNEYDSENPSYKISSIEKAK